MTWKCESESYTALSYRVEHSRGWTPCAFSFVPSFVADIQNFSSTGHVLLMILLFLLVSASWMQIERCCSVLSEQSIATCPDRKNRGTERSAFLGVLFLFVFRPQPGHGESKTSWSRKRRNFPTRRDFCSPARFEGWSLEFSDDVHLFLPKWCHPQVYRSSSIWPVVAVL